MYLRVLQNYTFVLFRYIKVSNSQVDIIIVNWNSGDHLHNVLGSINESILNVISQVIVIDNNSADDSLEKVMGFNWRFKIVYIQNNENIGFGRACNKAALICNQKYILFLNPDTIIKPNSVLSCLEFMEKDIDERYAVCGIRLLDSEGKVSRSCARIPGFFNILNSSLGLDIAVPAIFRGIIMREWGHDESRDVDHVIGAFYFVRNYLFKQIEGFNEDYFLYYEDLDLSTRFKRAGYSIRYISEHSAIHIGGGCSKKIISERQTLSNNSKIIYVRNFFVGYKRLILEFVAGTVELYLRRIMILFHKSKNINAKKKFIN
jgi:GT2 family glycosyltransferase